MKKILLLGFMLAFLANIKGQEYVPFPLDSAIWSVSNMKFSINGDTIINAKTFHKYYIQSDTVSFSFDFSKSNYIASLREENKQLFMIPKDSLNEYLMYDFSKSVGDTIIGNSFLFLPFNSSLYNCENIIESIDSIQIQNLYRKRIKIKSTSSIPTSPIEYWIEGIGSTNGLFFPGYYNHNLIDIPIRNLLCFEYKKQVFFQSSTSCFYYSTSSVDDLIIVNDIRIFPNPFSSFTEIVFDGNVKSDETYTVSIYSLSGEIVKNEDFSYSERIIINRENLESGLYYVILKNKKQIISKQKILIL